MLTFEPPVVPSAGTNTDREIKLRKTEFGDGYTQTTPDGINHIRKSIELNWDVLLPDDAETILAFFERHEGYKPFFYRPSNDPALLKWTCEEWSDERLDRGMRAVRAKLVQSFN
ncbi:MAG: phage tail protein [Roseibium sp.]|nr:phage tail protein [Roseibium sp.]